MTLEVIDDFDRLLKFEPRWSSFLQTINRITPFQLPEWLITWWRHFGSGQLQVLVFHREDEIAGIVPSFLHDWHGQRQITLIGSGISDYLEPAIAPEHCPAVLEHLEAYLRSNSNWDICDWQDLSFDTPLKHLASETVEDTECRLLALTGTFDDYWKARSKSLRQNVRRDRQKAELRGGVQFGVSMDPDGEPLKALIELHAARWRKRGQAGMIEANRSAAFLREVAEKFACRDMLHMFFLQFERRIAAVILAFQYAGTMFNYLTAFDPELEALALGRTLLYEAVRYSFEQKCGAWDFLRGNEPYKLWWGARSIPKCRIRVIRTA